jgi:hypothetical protein
MARELVNLVSRETTHRQKKQKDKNIADKK